MLREPETVVQIDSSRQIVLARAEDKAICPNRRELRTRSAAKNVSDSGVAIA